jgi:chemosensory pili system protein ChpA (sensor histidine kinase/response regulator)
VPALQKLARLTVAKVFRPMAGESLPFYWAGALLQVSGLSTSRGSWQTCRGGGVPQCRAPRVAMHVDEVLGNQEVVVKNLGPQLSRMPGLAGMSVLASGAVVLIYNPVALARCLWGTRLQLQAWTRTGTRRGLSATGF